MIFDLVAMNGGTRYLYNEGTFYTSFTKHIYTKNDTTFTVTNSGGYLELYYPDRSNSFDYYTPRINLTGFSKVYLEVTYSNSRDPMFYIGSTYYNYNLSALKSIQISETESTMLYEIDITDIVGEYYVGIVNFPNRQGETIRISKFYLQ